MEEINYNTKICPYCGNKASHPITGFINKDKETFKKWEESLSDCHLIKITDDGGTIGWDICCKNLES